MRYQEASWHRPYSGDEGLGFGQGDGTVSGELEGTATWANYPRRREDGVWTPNLRGVITTKSGEEVLLSIHGQSVEEDAPGGAVPLAEHSFPRRRGRDRRGARELVARRLRLRQRARAGPAGDRRATPREVPAVLAAQALAPGVGVSAALRCLEEVLDRNVDEREPGFRQ